MQASPVYGIGNSASNGEGILILDGHRAFVTEDTSLNRFLDSRISLMHSVSRDNGHRRKKTDILMMDIHGIMR